MAPEDNKSHARERTVTTADYVDALTHVVRPDSTYMHMLQFHYWQPEKTTTYEAMSAAMKFKGRFASNLYGGLGRRLGERLGWVPENPLNVLARFRYPDPERKCHWEMRGRLAAALETLGWVADPPEPESDSGESPEITRLFEGALKRVAVNAYERNPKARRACLAHYGAWCIICGFNFKAAYGQVAAGFMHVHHMQMIKEKGKKHEIDPIRDLRPVCPNCHSVIHIKPRPYTIQEVKEMVAAHRPPGWLDPPEVREARLRQPIAHFLRMTPKRSHAIGGHGAANNKEVSK
jgi:predicted HNH restriction endonuclease